MINKRVCSFCLKGGQGREENKQDCLTYELIFPVSVLCLERKKLIRLAGIKLRGGHGSSFLVLVPHCEK